MPLTTVLRNLINNAVKHHDVGGGNIWVKLSQRKNSGWVEVHDDGLGVPEVARCLPLNGRGWRAVITRNSRQ